MESKMKCILIDLNTGDVFSELIGWNKSESSLRTPVEWTKLIYHYGGQIKLDGPQYNGWNGRRLYCVPSGAPFEIEQLT
jgi:hypothetical protein